MVKNEKGLTLIELLITIAVIAIVAAISVPVVSNVIAASNTNSLNVMQEQVDQFVAEATQSGSVTLNGSTLEARIDQNGDGTPEYLVKTFPVDSKYTITEGTGGAYIVSTNGTTAPAAFYYTSMGITSPPWSQSGGFPAYAISGGNVYFTSNEYDDVANNLLTSDIYGNQNWKVGTPVLLTETGGYSPQYGYYTVSDAMAMLSNAVAQGFSVSYDDRGVATIVDGSVTAVLYYANSDPNASDFTVSPLN